MAFTAADPDWQGTAGPSPGATAFGPSPGTGTVKKQYHPPMTDPERRLRDLVEGRSATPFSVLGNHPLEAEGTPGRVVRAFLPWATEAWVARPDGLAPMEPLGDGLFSCRFEQAEDAFPYRLQGRDHSGQVVEFEDPYRFPPVLDTAELDRVRAPDGRVYEVLGSEALEHHQVPGVRFSVWAPWAVSVCVVGDFNGWAPWLHPLRSRGESGVWELFLPHVEEGSLYKYRIRTRGDQVIEKTDPCARSVALRPDTASRVTAAGEHAWGDASWMSQREGRLPERNPVSIYEVHLGSWRRHPGADHKSGDPGWLSYGELAETLLPYVAEMGFTHIELLPITEHPLDGSWGYQTTGYFAPTSRYGEPDDLRAFVDRAHALGIGVILDWVPAHFPRDPSGLGRFDGTHLYEHADPRKGLHPDWETYIFNLSRPEVVAFLISSALYWIEEFHIDGLRLDAVASMLYLDYSRKEGEWIPNEYGGRENHEAIDFLKTLNGIVERLHPDVWMIAEESTAWPRVSHPAEAGGLGFGGKWNMGWMNDTLEVMGMDPLFRKGSYEKLTFSAMYAFSERFVLPLSHDEVVHLKGSLLGKMPGSLEQKAGNLRVLLGYMWGHPGKKLLFMGGEWGVTREWDHEGTLDWDLLEQPVHKGLQEWVGALNRVYASEPALHATDWDGRGFEWLDCHDRDRTVLSFIRWAPEWTAPVLVVVNFTPTPWEDFRLAAPFAGAYRILLNSDDPRFGGTGLLSQGEFETETEPVHGRDHSIGLALPPYGVLFLRGPEGPPA